jgi:hypothetical protein
MRKSNVALRLQPSLLEEARKSAHANVPKALKILARAGVGNPPVNGDELPDASRKVARRPRRRLA